MLLFGITICFLFLFHFCISEKLILDVSDRNVLNEAEYAISELSRLSDSGIYESLKLSKLISAEEEEGIFHRNVILQMELSSPYFKRKNPTERFEIVVMHHKEDDVISIGIDEFPLMDEDAIEKFWILKVEEKRKKREEAIRQIELQSIFSENHEEEEFFSEEQEHQVVMNVSEQFRHLDNQFLRDLRLDSSALIQARLPPQQLLEEVQIAKKSLEELYLITIGGLAAGLMATDYAKYRAQQLIDLSVNRLQMDKTKNNTKKSSSSSSLHEDL